MTPEQLELLTQSKDRLSSLLLAEKAILTGAQSYSIGTRAYTRADLSTITKQITELNKTIIKLSRGGGIRIGRIVPNGF